MCQKDDDSKKTTAPEDNWRIQVRKPMPPYRIIDLMLNNIFGKENGRLYKLSWIPLIYYVAFEGTIFNLEYIISSILSSCVDSAQGGMNKKRSEFYMAS